MGIPWGDLVVGLVLLASGALGGSIFLLLKKGATATVAEIARTSESHLPETPDACSAPCDAHVALNSVVIELKKTVEAVVESMKVSADKVEKNHHEMFHRMANQDQSLAVTLQQMAEVRGQVGNIMADVAYMSAKMGKKHDAERIQKEVTDTTNELLQKNSEMLKESTIEIAKESERGIVDIETLKKVNNDLISTIEDTLKIQADGKAKRQMAETELIKIEQELKAKLLSVKA